MEADGGAANDALLPSPKSNPSMPSLNGVPTRTASPAGGQEALMDVDAAAPAPSPPGSPVASEGSMPDLVAEDADVPSWLNKQAEIDGLYQFTPGRAPSEVLDPPLCLS